MIFVRYIISLITAFLFSTLGTSIAFALPQTVTDLAFIQAQTVHFSQAEHIGFTARTPRAKVANVAATGGVTVMHGGAFVTHGVETQWASLNFGADLVATNRTLTPIDSPVDLVGFRRDHIMNRHGPGTGRSGKTEFPTSWDEQRILHNISDVATDPASRRVTSSHGTQVYGVRDGVEIRVDLYPDNHPRYPGQISTGFPVAGPNVPVNP